MNKIITTFIIYFALMFTTFGQNTAQNNPNHSINNIPEEKIFVHYNTTFLLPGENLNYKVYCLNTNDNNFSNLSKIAYVEMIGKNKKSVIKEKISLKNGVGEGYFFINSTVKSGSYKLIAYTQWSRNNNENPFFQADVSIINPFQANEEIISNKSDSTQSNNYKSYYTNLKSINEIIEINTNKSVFKNREKGIIKIKKNGTDFLNSSYSISVRRIDKLNTPKRSSATNYDLAYSKINSNFKSNNNNKIYLPELRGELLSGVVYDDKSKTSSNQKVALSIPGKDFIYKISNTNSNGIFYFNIDENYKGNDAVFQVIGNEREKYKIIINKQEPLEFTNLDFYDFKIKESSKELILQHSIYNQIENSYLIIKSDSIKSAGDIPPFYDSKFIKYHLDDYNRFPTLKETIVEIIPEIFVRTRKGNSTLHVRVYDEEMETRLTSLVLVDGIMVQDHNNLVEYNAKRIKNIEVVDELYLYGSQIFEGIISIETFDGEFKNNLTGSFIKSVELFKPQDKKIFYKQEYNTNNLSNRIPDYRIQLLWKPNLTLDKIENEIHFFTSDVSGDFEICLEGFTNDGKPVSLRKIITVE